MLNRSLLPILYAVSLLSVGPALFAKTLQLGSPATWLVVCLISQILFAIGAIAEIRNARFLSKEQKSKWNGWLLSSPLFFGFFYLKHFRE